MTTILLASPFYAQHWDAGHFWARALSRLNCSLLLWDYRIDPAPPLAQYDAALVLKGQPDTPEQLLSSAYKMCYWPDAFGRLPEAEAALRGYDRVYTMVRPTPEGMVWLPGAYDPVVHYPRAEDGRMLFDTLFIGTATAYKRQMLDELQVRIVFGNGWNQAIYLHEYAHTLSRALIAVNVHREPAVGVTRRLFEYISCTFTLTDLPPGVVEVLGPELADLVGFRTPQQGRERIAYYLAHPKDRAEVWAAERRAIRQYTYGALATSILEHLEKP